MIRKLQSARSGTAKGKQLSPHQGPQWNIDDLIRALDQMLVAKDSYSIAAVNMSLGTGGIRFPDQKACDAVSPDLKEKIDFLREAGIATVIAAGNNLPDGFTDGLTFPGCISSAVSVGATAIQ